MTDSGEGDAADIDSAAHRPSASILERVLAGIAGVATTALGALAVFTTENEVGTGALLVAGAAFLAMAIFGLVPVRLKVGDREVWVARAALRAITEVAKATDSAAQEEIVEQFEEELETHGIQRDQAEAVESMLSRFERYSGSPDARLVHDALVGMGWRPSVPPKSTYIRWVYTGRKAVSLFQRSGSLAVATVQAREYAKTLPGAADGTKDVVFAYAGDPNIAIDAAAALQRYADT
ncbi:hypothetical protein ACIA49_15480 [Kribbella sp. NPDC051587]|uniref:hypothetical protein n=1 Tax=Kribbella sp. NPDC051587 TaxID=3364119 RepID=UPI0037A14700